MKPFTRVKSRIVPIAIKDVDTDMIIPAQYLTNISRSGFGEGLFAALKSSRPDFPLNDKKYTGAQILVADSNFGCGSSREHAVWAVTGAGFQVIIAKSFADIFSNNSGKNGLLLVKLPEKIVDDLLIRAAKDNVELTVDLASQTVSETSGAMYSFEIEPFLKECLLKGLDELEYLRDRSEVIAKFKASQSDRTFFSSHTPNNDIDVAGGTR